MNRQLPDFKLDLDDKVLGLKPELDALDKTLMGLEREGVDFV